MMVEIHNYGIELVSVEVGNTESDSDDLKIRERSHSIIELKDIMDSFRDLVHLKRRIWLKYLL